MNIKVNEKYPKYSSLENAKKAFIIATSPPSGKNLSVDDFFDRFGFYSKLNPKYPRYSNLKDAKKALIIAKKVIRDKPPCLSVGLFYDIEKVAKRILSGDYPKHTDRIGMRIIQHIKRVFFVNKQPEI